LLAKNVAQGFEGKVEVVTQDFGESELAERFGVARYPAVFVDEVLVARPKDFGFYGVTGSQGQGRYAPWMEAGNRERFAEELTRMIELALTGSTEELAAAGVDDAGDGGIESLPAFSLFDLTGRELTREALQGRAVVVEFWATWCPPCRSTLDWLGELQESHGDEIAVLAIAVESHEDEVRDLITTMHPGVHWLMGTPELAADFGDVVAVPTMMIFDRAGRAASTFYGAPASLHDNAEAVLDTILR
jgi:thiol-disulfide isomerase/thioredoxin